MTLKTPSNRSEFAGFPAYYEAAIAPYLAQKESDRAETVTKILMLAVSSCCVILFVMAFAPFGSANTYFAALLGAVAAGAGATMYRKARNDITHGLIERITKKFGFSYRGEMARPDYYDRFKGLKLLPEHNREAWEDEVAGEHAGAAFVICEAHLKFKSSGKNSSTRTVFHGQLFMIDYPRRFLGETVVLRDMGPLNALMRPGGGFRRVGLASAIFEKAFEAWSTDQVEARDLLDPIVLERFQELERLYGGRKLRAAFADGKILIAIETGDRLNMGSMFRPLQGADRVETILREFDVIFDLIDVLLQRVEGRIDGAFSIGAVKRL